MKKINRNSKQNFKNIKIRKKTDIGLFALILVGGFFLLSTLSLNMLFTNSSLSTLFTNSSLNTLFTNFNNIEKVSTFFSESIHTSNDKQKKFVYPLGYTVGIKANTDGVLVIGYEDDTKAYVGGIQIGDNIVGIEDEKIKDSSDVVRILNEKKLSKIKITVLKNDKYKTSYVNTKIRNGNYMLGLWVRDKISGIGTMTFYDASTNMFSAIGHPIKDTDTNELLKIRDGYIYRPDSINIIKSKGDEIGYLEGDYENSKKIGEFSNNENIGIRGSFADDLEKDDLCNLLEVANESDIKKGKAYILFEGKKYDANIYDIKSEEILLEVIDDKFIDTYGGIVQGMSGSPIIQNNKIVGALTHVSKEDAKKGYGLFIQEMLK
ncbi:MAG: peptidase S55 [Clostridioides sp.]|nr:peptidase S55 [Clostridioides sp.]